MSSNPIIADPNGRDRLGRFAPGTGNTGRPRGVRNAVSRDTLRAVEDLFSDAVRVLRVKLAENDLNAAKIVLNVVLPKDRAIEFGEDASPATIEAAMACGAITPTEAQQAAQALEKLATVRDFADMQKRLDELESAVAERRS